MKVNAVDGNDTPGRRIVIGVDEAGYGPNIGPMLVAATAWGIPESMSESDFSSALSDHFRPQGWKPGCTHIPLGDSKQLYQTASGLASLELGLLAMIQQLDIAPRCFRKLLEAITVNQRQDNIDLAEFHAWHAPLEADVPCAIPWEQVVSTAKLAQAHLESLKINLVDLQAYVITESAFNQAVAGLGSKGRLLSDVTLNLVRSIMSRYPSSNIEVFCDRQGGRKRYSSVLAHAFPDEWFDVIEETSERSSYRRLRSPNCIIHFTVGGDSFPPTALASMTAKYLRERFMGIINQYWQRHVADLRPTAGYPTDAKRFREAIESSAHALGHSSDQWWRVC